MQSAVTLAFLVSLVALLATGGRMLWTWRRTRQLPELAIGLTMLLGATGGVVEITSIRMIEAGADPHTAFLVQAASRLCYMLGSASLFVGLWRIFRPSTRWARALAVGGGLGSFIICGVWMAGGQHTSVSGPDGPGLAFHLGRMSAYVWGAWESFTYYGRMKRRIKLGLADPLIAHQFWLWGVASVFTVVLVAAIIFWFHGLGITPLDTTAGTLTLMSCSLVIGATIYSAFFPPAFYRKWVASRV